MLRLSRSLSVFDSRWIENVGKACQNLVGGANTSNPALVDERNALAASHLVEIRRRGYDGDIAFLEVAQHLPEFLARHGVNTRRGLIEEKYAGAVYQSARECQLLLHATRERTSPSVLETLNLAVNRLDAVITFLDRRAEQGGKELQVLLDCQILVKRELARHITHPAADVSHLAHRIKTVDCHRA